MWGKLKRKDRNKDTKEGVYTKEYESKKVQRDIDNIEAEIKNLSSEKKTGVNVSLIKKYKEQLSTLTDKLSDIENQMEEKK